MNSVAAPAKAAWHAPNWGSECTGTMKIRVGNRLWRCFNPMGITASILRAGSGVLNSITAAKGNIYAELGL